MKRTLIYTVAILMLAGMTAHAKEEQRQNKGKPEKEMKQAEDLSNADNARAEPAREKEKSGEAQDKGRSEEMKNATTEKNAEKQAAKDAGEKQSNEAKSWWKFWK
jgi:hypothetical protein